MEVFGLDVSYWQDRNDTPQQIDFAKAKQAGAEFVICRAGFGMGADQDIIYNARESRASGLVIGFYWFMVYELDPIKQAELFWSTIEKDPGDFRPTIDFEWWNIVPSNAIKLLARFRNRLKELSGEWPMIYTGPYFWQQYGSKDKDWALSPLWMANYNKGMPNPWTVPDAKSPTGVKTLDSRPWGDNGWLLWQTSSKGDGKKYGCESESVDTNVYNGSLEWFKACYVTNPPATHPPEPTDAEKLSLLWSWYKESH